MGRKWDGSKWTKDGILDAPKKTVPVKRPGLPNPADLTPGLSTRMQSEINQVLTHQVIPFLLNEMDTRINAAFARSTATLRPVEIVTPEAIVTDAPNENV